MKKKVAKKPAKKPVVKKKVAKCQTPKKPAVKKPAVKKQAATTKEEQPSNTIKLSADRDQFHRLRRVTFTVAVRGCCRYYCDGSVTDAANLVKLLDPTGKIGVKVDTVFMLGVTSDGV